MFPFQGSKFYENELKKDQQVNQRIEKMMLQKARITQAQLKKAQAQVQSFQEMATVSIITLFFKLGIEEVVA